MVQPIRSEEQVFVDRRLAHDPQVTALVSEEKLPCVTQDGVEISLLGNVGLPDEIEQVADHHLDGVGLFRTEFLFIESVQRPSYELQVEIYGDMANRLSGSPMVIRTFDLGGDKMPPFLGRDDVSIPSSLHLRGLRFSFSEKDLLETQLQAIVQVAQTADVRILFPMVIGSHDFKQASPRLTVGPRTRCTTPTTVSAMIETPAALFALDELLNSQTLSRSAPTI